MKDQGIILIVGGDTGMRSSLKGLLLAQNCHFCLSKQLDTTVPLQLIREKIK